MIDLLIHADGKFTSKNIVVSPDIGYFETELNIAFGESFVSKFFFRLGFKLQFCHDTG